MHLQKEAAIEQQQRNNTCNSKQDRIISRNTKRDRKIPIVTDGAQKVRRDAKIVC
jgi:hypothetical protein